MPIEINSPLQFRTLLNGHTYLVADFTATWCPPCKVIAPIYEQLASANAIAGKLAFVSVNVDEQQEVTAQYGIQAMPTFLIFKDGKQIEEIKGANPPALKKVVERIAADVKTQVTPPKPKPAEEKKEGEEEQTVSGSYEITGGKHWKMSLT